MKRRIVWVLGAIGAGLLSGCDSRPEVDTSHPGRTGAAPDIGVSLVEEGKANYQTYCIGCHGAAGDGAGEAALYLNPRPRNFVLANFKFSSTRSGQLPTEEDLRRTIRNGLRGSAMPSFNLLPERTIESLVAYIKTFSPKWKDEEPAAPIPMVEDPYRALADKSEAIRRGEQVYHGYAICWSCHPSYVPEKAINEAIVSFGSKPREGFRPNLHQSEGKASAEGEMLYPPDFRRDYVRAGMRAEDLYRSISAGITGTAMPTWVDSIDIPGEKPGSPPLVSKADLWAMAYYVQHLIGERPPLLAQGGFQVRDRARPIYLHGAPPPPAEPEPAPADSTTTAPVQPADSEFQP